MTFFKLFYALNVLTRDGHADADDAEVCGLVRICGCDLEDKICMRIEGKKNKVKYRTKLGRRRAKTVKILNKNSQKSIKNRPKKGPKW